MRILVLKFLFLALIAGVALADEAGFTQLDEQSVAIKRDMLELGKDMYRFEQEALYPEASRIEIYLTMDVGEFFDLRSLRVVLANNIIFAQEYTENQSEFFSKGAAQRLYINSLDSGEYELIAYFEGIGPRNRKYKRAVKKVFRKNGQPVYLELAIRDNVKRLQPEFEVKVL